MIYDYLIVGAGFYGATFARLMTDAGKKCLVVDCRPHIGGNAYSERREGIDVHMYGPHIFHTNDTELWNFINQFSEFNNFILSPKSYTKGKLYSLPFNMNTFHEMWNCITPEQAKNIIQKQKFLGEPKNLEEQALSLVGKDIYELLIREYTMKQWQKDPKDLPSFIIKRLPLRFTFDNNYFDDKYQGIPVNGYTKIFELMLNGIETRTDTDYFENKNYFDSIANKVVFTGKIDEYFNYEFGELEYRSLDFIHKTLNTDNFQGNAVINYPDISIPWTRIIEHKHFTKTKSDVTIVTTEIPTEWNRAKVPYYPINDHKNNMVYQQYRDKSDTLDNVIFGGRLAKYQYMDMHQVIAGAMKDVKLELHK
jgi:UDP-galactopyranose mutase